MDLSKSGYGPIQENIFFFYIYIRNQLIIRGGAREIKSYIKNRIPERPHNIRCSEMVEVVE